MDGCKYWAFISYSHRDAQWGQWLHKAIESYRPPQQLIGVVTDRGRVPKRLTPIFRDRDELASATDLGTVIHEALQNSASLIVICSPDAASSRWVNEEILAYKRLRREDHIFPIIVSGHPNASTLPGREAEECFPPALRFRLGPDGNLSEARAHPVAADARPDKDGKSNAKLKLVAGLLGVGYDALRRREQHRRNRKLATIAVVATAGMVLASALAVYALVQRSAALIQRTAAQKQTVRAEAEAETARQTTAFLVDLFRISDPSEARGNSMTAREALDRGAARVEKQLAKQPQVQATLLDTLGTVYMGLGLYGHAQPLLDSAIAKRSALTPPKPADLAISLSHAGDLLTLRAKYADAEAAYRKAIALQTSVPADQRDDAALARSLYGLGNELENSGRSADAEQTLREALKLQQQIFKGASEDTARTLQQLAWAIRDRDLTEATPMMQSAVAMQHSVWGAEPYPDYASALNDLGLILRDKGDYDQSEKLLRESLAMERRLVGDKHSDLALMLNNLALTLWRKGDLADAESTYRQALAMQRELLGDVHPDVALTLNNLAFVLYDRGDARAALQAERESLGVYQRLFPNDNPNVAATMNRLGYWLTEEHDYAAADRYLEGALAMRRRLFGPSHPEIASSLLHVGILQVAQHKYQDALVSARIAGEIYTAELSPAHWKTAIAESIHGAALAGLGEYTEAEVRLIKAYTILSNDAGAPSTYRKLARRYLQNLYRSWGRPGDARRYAETE